MPRVSCFYGISIYLYDRDHAPPHVHALYGEHEVLLRISDLEPMQGFLPKRAMAMVSAWAKMHRQELEENWDRAQQGLPLRPIEPLEEESAMILRIERLRLTGPHRLHLVFNDGTEKSVNVRPLLEGPIFEPLHDPDVFDAVVLDPETGTVSWPNGADLAPEALHGLPAERNVAAS